MMLCACGCGLETRYIWAPGHDVLAIQRGRVTKQTAGLVSVETVDPSGFRQLLIRCANGSELVWQEQPTRGQWLGKVTLPDGRVVRGCQEIATVEIEEGTKAWNAVPLTSELPPRTR